MCLSRCENALNMTQRCNVLIVKTFKPANLLTFWCSNGKEPDRFRIVKNAIVLIRPYLAILSIHIAFAHCSIIVQRQKLWLSCPKQKKVEWFVLRTFVGFGYSFGPVVCALWLGRKSLFTTWFHVFNGYQWISVCQKSWLLSSWEDDYSGSDRKIVNWTQMW